ncbi:MAG: LysR family transcriptional regulator [Alphaproteobacteria bacterium]|nr:LysR family transcriptional regulator [Alphaproteobacteria bacterium]
MGRPLPNLNQLRAFESAARHLSFKLAADELHVTHAAISHQIKALEEDLGIELFRRVTRGVKLLPHAEAFAAELSRNFEAMAEAAARVRGGRSLGPLRLSSVPAYGMRVLLPRLSGFKKRFPGVDVKIDLELALTDFQEMDGAIRYGRGNWPNVGERLLHRDIVTPVCKPDLVKGLTLPMAAERILSFPIAQSPGDEDDWKAWLQAAGHRGDGPKDCQRMENRAVVLDYVLTGSGIAMVDLRFAASELAAGRLVRLHPAIVEGVKGVYLVYPRTGFPDSRLTAFGTWLAAEATAMDISPGCPWEQPPTG